MTISMIRMKVSGRMCFRPMITWLVLYVVIWKSKIRAERKSSERRFTKSKMVRLMFENGKQASGGWQTKQRLTLLPVLVTARLVSLVYNISVKIERWCA